MLFRSVVGTCAGKGHPVMAAFVQPVADIMAGEPAPPADHQMGLNNVFDNGYRDIDDGPEKKDRVKQ